MPPAKRVVMTTLNIYENRRKMYDKETGEDLSENYSKYLGDQIGYSSDEITTIHSYTFSEIYKKEAPYGKSRGASFLLK